MQSLRNAHNLVRFVLVWFALFLGVAIASPLVNPQATQLVCSAAGAVKLVGTGADDSMPMQSHGLDCVLCLALNAPPVDSAPGFAAPKFLAFALPSAHSAWVVKRTAAPPLARGPPSA